MNTNPATSAVNLIHNAQYKTAEATRTISKFPIEKDEVGSPDFKSHDLVKPLLSLKEAEIETSAAVKILQAEDEMLGSIFDATV